jgi:hypothetical protein
MSDETKGTLPPLRISRADGIYSRVKGAACAVIAVGDPARFEAGAEGVLVRFKDDRIRYEAGRSEGCFFRGEFEDPDVALAHARVVAGSPAGLIRVRGAEFTTSRGSLRVDPVVYTDGGRTPRLPEDLHDRARAAVYHGLGIAFDSEGHAAGPDGSYLS